MRRDKNKMITNKKHITTSIFGVGRCEAAHKYENGDFCQNKQEITTIFFFEKNKMVRVKKER